MKRALVTIKVNNYRPEICALTFPSLKNYADRIKADFISVENRQFENWHPAYEKLQCWEISADYDQTLLIDADIALHPKFVDLLDALPADCCGSWMTYRIRSPELTLWATQDDPYFTRDGRNLGIVGSIVACTKLTRHIFKPLSEKHKPHEIQNKIYRPAIIDEYVMSRNMAKYGLKHQGLWPSANGIHHAEITTKGELDALEKLENQIKAWENA